MAFSIALFRGRKRACCFLCDGFMPTGGDTWHSDTRALYVHFDRPDEVDLSRSTHDEGAVQGTDWQTFKASNTHESLDAWWVTRAHDDRNCHGEADDGPMTAIENPQSRPGGWPLWLPCAHKLLGAAAITLHGHHRSRQAIRRPPRTATRRGPH